MIGMTCSAGVRGGGTDQVFHNIGYVKCIASYSMLAIYARVDNWVMYVKVYVRAYNELLLLTLLWSVYYITGSILLYLIGKKHYMVNNSNSVLYPLHTSCYIKDVSMDIGFFFIALYFSFAADLQADIKAHKK